MLVSSIDRIYPVNVELKDRYMSSCTNEELKDKRKFTVDRKKSNLAVYDWVFTAHLSKRKLSWLASGDNKKNKGVCNNVKTEDDSLGCGMATTLMEFCFTDYRVGGVDVENDQHFKKESLTKWREMAMQYCKHVVYLLCAPTAPDISCSAYLTAAINTNHMMMFTYQRYPADSDSEVMYVWDVAKTQPEFKKHAKKWISTYGYAWYFCQCNVNSECQTML